MSDPTKQCSVCLIYKPLPDFHTCSACKDGHRNTCKKCHNLKCSEYQKENEESIKEYKKDWAIKNKDRKQEMDRQWRENNKDYKADRDKQYYLKNKDKISQHGKEKWRESHPIPRKVTDPITKRSQKKIAKHRYRARLRELAATFTVTEWDRCLIYWKERCAYCGNQQGFFNPIEAEHWIPISSPDCPGTVASNMLPACKKCNCSKHNKQPDQWIKAKFGNKSRLIVNNINAYFDWINNQD